MEWSSGQGTHQHMGVISHYCIMCDAVSPWKDLWIVTTSNLGIVLFSSNTRSANADMTRETQGLRDLLVERDSNQRGNQCCGWGDCGMRLLQPITCFHKGKSNTNRWRCGPAKHKNDKRRLTIIRRAAAIVAHSLDGLASNVLQIKFNWSHSHELAMWSWLFKMWSTYNDK